MTPGVRRLSRRDARRVAVRAQLLTADRPESLLDVLRGLDGVQVEPTEAIAPSADVVVWSRIGAAHQRGDLEHGVGIGTLWLFQVHLRAAEEIALHRAEMDSWPGAGALRPWQVEQQGWLDANDHSRREVLELLHGDGPMPLRDLPDTTAVPWESSGWNNDRNVRMLISLMERRGEVAITGREGRDWLWDLAERAHAPVETVPLLEALAIRDAKRLAANGIERISRATPPGQPKDFDHAGVPVEVDGLKGRWRIDPELLDQPFRGRAALLSPIDRLVFDRRRTTELFEFDYQLEMYKPAAQRRWGYWAMPILYGDRLVGKLDATADPRAGVLVVNRVHEDGDWSPTQRTAVHREIQALASWLDLDVAREG